MFNIAAMHDFSGLFSLLLAYCMTIPFVGWFHAWVANKAGDDTGKRMGLMSFDLMTHVDFFGLIVLYMFGVGWGRRVPVRFKEIHYSYQWIKFIIALYAGTFAYFVVSLLTLLVLSLLFKESAIHILIANNGFNLTHAVGAGSAFSIASAGFLQKLAWLTMRMTRLSFVISSCYFLATVLSHLYYKKTNNELNEHYVYLLALFVWIFLFCLPSNCSTLLYGAAALLILFFIQNIFY